MRVTRVTVVLAASFIVASMAAAREVTRGAGLPMSTAAVSQAPNLTWFLVDAGDRLEARQINGVATSAVPYDAVVLRRTVGGVSLDCGTFAKPTLTDNAVSRIWTYEITRPRSGVCATVAGARFAAAGRKNDQETLTPAVP